jgi:hypothetical protein
MGATKDSVGIEKIAGALGLEHGNGMPSKNGDIIPQPDYDVNTTGEHLFTWKDEVTKEVFRIEVAHPERSGTDFWCVLSVRYQQSAFSESISIMPGKRWNLTSTSSTTQQVQSLNRRMPERGWEARLVQAEELLRQHVQTGDDLLDLSGIDNPPPPSYAVWPLLEQNEHNIIGADGGSTKSILAMALAISYSYKGNLIPGFTSPQEGKPTLYLDYESSSNTQAYRRRLLLEGVGIPEQAGKVFYKRMYSPVVDAATELYDIINSRNIGLVIIDSGSRAVGGETSTENMVIPYFNACASWGTTVLTVVHKAKSAESRGPAGVAQWWNQARNYWELVKDQTPGQPEVYVSFRHDKANDESLHEAMSYRLEFTPDFIKYHKEDVVVSNNILAELHISTQIAAYLDEFPSSTAKEIAAGINKSDKHVLNELKKGEGKLFYGTAEARNRRWTNIRQRPDSGAAQEELPYWNKD